MAANWKSSGATHRWEVLNALVERIHVRQDRKINGCGRRLDRAHQARMLVRTGFDYAEDGGARSFLGGVEPEAFVSAQRCA